mmetsp:Transcript_1131/g.1813  ORF Transcript_1131/g.1813 Transcript_1131/m.1813 type:complete len:89 (+) Transcript_1131:81-347(+)
MTLETPPLLPIFIAIGPPHDCSLLYLSNPLPGRPEECPSCIAFETRSSYVSLGLLDGLLALLPCTVLERFTVGFHVCMVEQLRLQERP